MRRWAACERRTGDGHSKRYAMRNGRQPARLAIHGVAAGTSGHTKRGSAKSRTLRFITDGTKAAQFRAINGPASFVAGELRQMPSAARGR
jgi:hypothetical protein